MSNRLFRNDGGGAFTDATTGALGDLGYALCAAWADYDNDGDLDLYRGETGPNTLVRNDGGTFVDVTGGPLADFGNGVGVAWGDYDNDGDPDIYLANNTTANRLFRNDGGGAFVNVTSGPLGVVGWSFGVAWGDYDNDGDLDLYCANLLGNFLFRNDGGGAFTDVSAGPVASSQATGVTWIDYNHDGYVDLYLSTNGVDNLLFRNDGGTFTDVTAAPLDCPGPGYGVAAADYDGDGDQDLYLLNYNEPNKLFRNDVGTLNNWLNVKLTGTVSNRDGIGARVRVVAGGMGRIVEISGGSGYYSQNSLVADFGLGSAATIDSVVVHWPSGIVQVVSPVPAVNQRITVVESSPVNAPPGSETVHASALGAAFPNPFTDATRVGLALTRGGPVTVEILDVHGRRVTRLVDRALGSGRHEITWDGRDAAGRRVGSGIYYLRVLSDELRGTLKIVRIQ